MTIKYKKAGSNGWPITGGDVDNTTHAVNEDSGNCFASYRYGTPRYVAAINGTLAGPGVPKEANSGSGYFLAGDEITLNAPSLQVSETDTTNIPFDKWFSFTSDAVITNATSQNGAKLTVQDKDIEVRANYKAFTVQPVFERESGTKGTVTFTLISNEFNQSNWIKIRPINDLTISRVTLCLLTELLIKQLLKIMGLITELLPANMWLRLCIIIERYTVSRSPWTTPKRKRP